MFRRVPPAVFPPVFGLMGLGVAWRQAVGVFGLNSALVEAVMGAISLLFAYCVMAYGVKAVVRPGAVAEDLRTLAGADRACRRWRLA